MRVSPPAEERQIRVCNYFSLKTLDVSGKFAVYAVCMSPVNTKRNDRLTKLCLACHLYSASPPVNIHYENRSDREGSLGLDLSLGDAPLHLIYIMICNTDFLKPQQNLILLNHFLLSYFSAKVKHQPRAYPLSTLNQQLTK